MFTSDVSEPLETPKQSILKRRDLTDRQSLDQLFNNIDLQHGSAAYMLLRMREVIGQRTFSDCLFRKRFLTELPQQVKALLVTFQNNAVYELVVSVDRIFEITKSSNRDGFSVKEKPQTTQNDITELCHTRTLYLRFRNDRKRSHTTRRSTSPCQTPRNWKNYTEERSLDNFYSLRVVKCWNSQPAELFQMVQMVQMVVDGIEFRVLESSNSMATTLIGTPYYMSPELFANKPYNHKVPDMPTQYSPELLELMRAMLHLKPEKRPSARRVLSNSFIRKHIVLFLEATKDRANHSQNHSTTEDEVQNTNQLAECETGVPSITNQPSNEIKMSNEKRTNQTEQVKLIYY
ncbi:unnamed protein product [Schistosoma margrebowiei]|uniref:non-specific serine/threonine protein kinase n=1 Tax=Schistosoma margrebowiei TaxID=48269 RepID=A0A183LPE8_9TREM|nr:unnamed protein product [Schistosoma margrebowiei]